MEALGNRCRRVLSGCRLENQPSERGGRWNEVRRIGASSLRRKLRSATNQRRLSGVSSPTNTTGRAASHTLAFPACAGGRRASSNASPIAIAAMKNHARYCRLKITRFLVTSIAPGKNPGIREPQLSLLALVLKGIRLDNQRIPAAAACRLPGNERSGWRRGRPRATAAAP
jgi:hypothetical protein